METATGNFANSGQALADKAADKVQSGIRDALADAGPALRKAAVRGQFIGKQGMDAVSDAAQRAREIASDASDSIISYTKENPLKALMIAAASGALLLGLIKLAKSSRN
jgi:ElaB/YqjD/DUF883 family membrane-anchored ribosome-binding protein